MSYDTTTKVFRRNEVSVPYIFFYWLTSFCDIITLLSMNLHYTHLYKCSSLYSMLPYSLVRQSAVPCLRPHRLTRPRAGPTSRPRVPRVFRRRGRPTRSSPAPSGFVYSKSGICWSSLHHRSTSASYCLRIMEDACLPRSGDLVHGYSPVPEGRY